MSDQLPHDLVTPVDAAHIAEISIPTLIRAIRAGELKVHRDDPLTPGAKKAKATWLSQTEVRRWRDARRAGRQS